MRLALAVFVLVPLAVQGQQAPRAEVPVSSVVLFSSGVGYFEHSGTIRGGTSTELRFRATQMNDVIKSLVLQDLDGGKVGSITYPSQDPLSKTLKSFQVDITSNPSVAQLLNQLRGSRITVQAQGERIAGTILGVEMRAKAGPTPDAIAELPVLNVVSGGTIRSIDLQTVTSLTLDDTQLQDELTKALTSLGQSRDQDKKPVIINFMGSGDRHVKVAYVVEAPVWKTSYRLLLDDKQAHIQGWGVVENQTESDWNNVSLSLVSGRPISFRMDLYSPIYLQRPLVEPEQYAQLKPQIYLRGLREAADSVAGPPGLQRRIGYDAQGKPIANRLSEMVVTGTASGLNAAASVESQATGQQLGELFEFTVRNVTLARQKSAMIPIVTDAIQAERVSIYNANVLAANPLNGIRLRNTTGKSLLQGPVTIFDHELYAGDARIGDLPAGQERLLSYGVDLETIVNAGNEKAAEHAVTSKIVRGVLQVDWRKQTSRDYVAENKSDRPRTLIIEHPIIQGWKLFDSPTPYETTNEVHRFRVELPAGKKVTTTIKQEWIYNQAYALAQETPTSLLTYTRSGEISRSVRAAIEKAIELKQKAQDLAAQADLRGKRIAEISGEQVRIRENMKTIGQTSQYYERLLAKLNEQESQIEQLQKEQQELWIKRDAAQREVAEYLANLTLN